MNGAPTNRDTGRIDTNPDELAVLMARVQGGDRSAFAELYDQLASISFAVASRVVRDRELAEDVLQESFVEVWSNAARFDPTFGSVKSWVVTIVRRRAVDRVRREESQRSRVIQLAGRRSDEVVDTADDVVESIEAQRVRRAIMLLPADQRQVVRLAFLDGHSHSVIADQLDLPLGTVKGRIRGALTRLSAALKEES
jgi:RNA polymerase sigma-70 factor, ECF subfamily